VRGVELIDRIRAGGRPADAVEVQPVMHNAPKPGRLPEQEIGLLTDLCETMKFGSLCALGGFTPFPVMSALKNWPEDFMPARRRKAPSGTRHDPRRRPRRGQSTRFGSDKALAELGGHTLLNRAFDTLTGFCELVVIAGRDRARATASPTGRTRTWARSRDRRRPASRARRRLRQRAHDRRGFDRLPENLLELLSPAPAYVESQPVIGHWPAGAVDAIETLLLAEGRHSMLAFAGPLAQRPVKIGAKPANINTPADLAAGRESDRWDLNARQTSARPKSSPGRWSA
jgi:molybdopterin-guanine dinucleotide biosynthesis protein A